MQGRRQEDSHELLRIVVGGLRDEMVKAEKQISQQGRKVCHFSPDRCGKGG
jgi:hypothetical protein